MKDVNQTPAKWFKQPKYYAAGVIGLVCMVVFGWWAGSSYMQNRPEVIMADALANSIKTVTDTSPLQRDITVMYQPSEAQKGIPVTFALSGISQGGTYSAEVKLSTSIVGQTTTLSGNFIAVDGEYYLQLTDIEESLQKTAGANPLLSPYISYGSEIAKKYEGIWINITPENGTKLASSACSDALANTALNDDEKAKIKELYIQNPVFTDVEKVGIESINNQPSYHLRASVSKPAYSAFAKELLKPPPLSGVASKCSSQDQQTTTTMQGDIDFWVSKESREFTKIQYAQKQGVTSIEFSTSPTTTIPGTTSKPESSVTLEQFKTDLESVIGTVL